LYWIASFAPEVAKSAGLQWREDFTAMLSGMKAPAHKVIITGTGRAGTTFLVRLLTELGLDTGYTQRNWSRDYFVHCDAGLEHNLTDPRAPYIVKNPALCETLESILADGHIVIDHAFIPIRELDAAASSRIRVGGANESVPGGLLKNSDPALQKSVLAEMFHQLVHTLVARDIPHTFLLFPRFACDADYAYARLRPILGCIPLKTFREAFARVSNPALIHDFSRPETRLAGVGEKPYRQYRQERQHRRRVRHTIRWALSSAAALGLLLLYPVRHKLHWTSHGSSLVAAPAMAILDAHHNGAAR
jgi:hypothetical protein